MFFILNISKNNRPLYLYISHHTYLMWKNEVSIQLMSLTNVCGELCHFLLEVVSKLIPTAEQPNINRYI